jgi:hypothetical protein
MFEPLSQLPTRVLADEARSLEHRLIAGVADAAEIDAFVAFASELGRRQVQACELSDALDALLDPRD